MALECDGSTTIFIDWGAPIAVAAVVCVFAFFFAAGASREPGFDGRGRWLRCFTKGSSRGLRLPCLGVLILRVGRSSGKGGLSLTASVIFGVAW